MNENAFPTHIMGTSEFKSLLFHEKALKLIQEQNVSKKLVVKRVQITQQALDRAAVAKERNRDLGREGRPNKLNSTEMNNFVVKVNSHLEQNEEITYEVAELLVRKAISSVIVTSAVIFH
jgi:hypothetical protein